MPPATRGARPGRAGAKLPPYTEIRFSRPFFTFRPEISYQRGKIRRLLLESGAPALYLSWSFRVPAKYLRLPFRRSWPSHGGGPLTVAFHLWRGLQGRGRLGPVRAGPVPVRCPGARRASGPSGVQRLGLRDRNAATAVVNRGGSTPPVPPAPRQVMSQVIVAVAWNAPSGCPALEVV
jgi:hypothetical protein